MGVLSRITVAAIEVAPTSAHLLVGAVDEPGAALVTVDRRTTPTDPALGRARTVSILREYRHVADALGADRMLAVVRDTPENRALLAAVSEALGEPAEPVSPTEASHLSFIGATGRLGQRPPYLVVDIGATSTTLAWGAERPEVVVTLDAGSVDLTEAFLRSDPPSPVELSQAVSVVRDGLEDLARRYPLLHGAETVVGAPGIPTTVAAVEIGPASSVPGAVDGFRLTRAAAEDVFRTLATEREDDRRHNPGLRPELVPTVVGGSVVLVGVMRYLGHDEMVVSEAGLLEGLARSLAS